MIPQTTTVVHEGDADVLALIEREVGTGFERFWSRFGSLPEFAGKRILEIGCGRGALSVTMAHQSPERVVGVDILEDDIRNANAFVEQHAPQLAGILEFTTSPLASFDAGQFDLIVSKDAFEHIIDVTGMLNEIRRLLTPDGRVCVGFSPLYHSPFGDHDRRRTAFRSWGLPGRLLAAMPWGHLLTEPLIISRHRSIQSFRVDSMHDLNLNKLSVSEFNDLVGKAGFAFEYYAVNQGDSRLGKVLSAMRRLPGLAKYTTYNLYCVLRPQAR